MTPEFARQISELSHETRRQIGALIDRKGYVEFVIVGDARRIELPDFKRVRVAGDRFRGLRCVHTHLRGEELTRDDLTDLALLRLDLMPPLMSTKLLVCRASYVLRTCYLPRVGIRPMATPGISLPKPGRASHWT